jgi:hypothetical protein
VRLEPPDDAAAAAEAEPIGRVQGQQVPVHVLDDEVMAAEGAVVGPIGQEAAPVGWLEAGQVDPAPFQVGAGDAPLAGPLLEDGQRGDEPWSRFAVIRADDRYGLTTTK